MRCTIRDTELSAQQLTRCDAVAATLSWISGSQTSWHALSQMLLVAAPCLLQIRMSKGHSGADPGSLCQAEVGCILRGCENEEV